ncbi:MAG: ATP-binding protein, partial [Planctomycetota bacterium]
MGKDEFRYQIINEMPYPLGLLYRNLCQSYLLYEETQQQEAFRRDLFSFGYGFSHFLSLLNLKQYLAEDPLSSPNLNKQILQTFRSKPAIRWQILLTQNLTKVGFRPFIQELKDILQKPVPMALIAPFQDDETLHEDCISILSYFFEIPNPLSSKKIKAYFQLAEFLLQEYSFLKEYYLVVPQEDHFWLCQGTQPKLTRMRTALQFDRHWEGHLFLVSKSQSYLNLHPFIVFKKHENQPELHFLHQEIASRVQYVGHGLKSLYLDNELAPGILSHYQKIVISLRNFSLTSRVQRFHKPSELPQRKFIQFHLNHFLESHRQKEFSALKKFLQDEIDGYAVIYGPSGIGKTALLCKIYEEKHKNHFWYFFHPLAEVQNTPEDFYQVILLQMKLAFSLAFNIPSNLKELHLLFWEVSSQCAQLLKQEEKKLVIWIDGINDIAKTGTEYLLEYLPKKLPENVLFIFTLQTQESQFLNALNLFYLETRIHPIPTLSPMIGLDFRAFSELLRSIQTHFLFKQETLNRLFFLIKNQEERISPLYLNLLKRCLQISKDKMLQPYRFPKNEQDCFLFLWNRIPLTDHEMVFRYLAILSLMQEKGTDDLFCRLFHKSHEYISEIFIWLDPFLIQDEEGYQIFHPRIKEFIQEQFQSVELAQFHFQLAQFYDKPEEQAWFQIENTSTFYYLTYHYYYYFQFSKNSKWYLEIIEDPTYIREKERRIRGFQSILDELKLTIQLFSSENNFAKLIRYGFKYNNTKNYREKGLTEVAQLFQQGHYGELLQIFKDLDSLQSKRLGILFIAYVCAEQHRPELQSALEALTSLSSMGMVLELRHFYIPMVKKLVALNLPELLHFNRNLSQIHFRTLHLLPEASAEIDSKKFYHHIHLLFQFASKDIEDPLLYENLLCLIITSQADEFLDFYFQETRKKLSSYGKYTPIDLSPFLIRLGSTFYKRGFLSELETIKKWVEIHFPIQDSELQENPDWEELAETREEVRKALALEICRQKAFQWLGESYSFKVTAIPSLSKLTLIEIDDLIEAIVSIEDFSLQAQLVRQLLEALEAYITPSHEFKIKILEQIYQKCFHEKHPSVEFLVRMCKIYQESARNIQSNYSHPLLLELCKQLKNRSQITSLEKIIQEERHRLGNQPNSFLYELNQLLSPNSSIFESIPLLEWNASVIKWFQEEIHYEDLDFERFSELICLLKQEDFLNLEQVT